MKVNIVSTLLLGLLFWGCNGEDFPKSFTYVGNEEVLTEIVTINEGQIIEIENVSSAHYSDPLGFVQDIGLPLSIEKITLLSEAEIQFTSFDGEVGTIPYNKSGAQLLSSPFRLLEADDQLEANTCLKIIVKTSSTPGSFGIEGDYTTDVLGTNVATKLFQERGLSSGDTLSYTLFKAIFRAE